MFSSRLEWNLPVNRLSTLLKAKTRVLDLTESNPTRAGFTYSSEAILGALADPRAIEYDPQPRGLAAAREAVSLYYGDVPQSRILLTASTSEAYAYLFKLLCDPGDEILSPRPSYPLFEFLAGLESVRVTKYPLRYDGAWHIDFDALRRAITPRTRAIVVVNPNNPTGSFLKREEWTRLEEFGIPILSDEVFCDYSFSSDPSRVRTLTGAQNVLTFSMSGLSKVAGLPQMKLGWIAASGPGHKDALERLELIADTYLSVATPVQIALPRILAESAAVRDQIVARTRANLETLKPACPLHVEGGWYAILQVPRTKSEEEWAIGLLERRDVLVQPGFYFDLESEAYLVLSLLTRPEVFEEGRRRILEEIG
ncbi:MAG TPA: pyridoxal phosphate-dependent aminotransferase [Bryobacteraceae bacterium]|nr:pyridoxal phosphate-dependent aminotransferase [Bryobacteraceae bacterium]